MNLDSEPQCCPFLKIIDDTQFLTAECMVRENRKPISRFCRENDLAEYYGQFNRCPDFVRNWILGLTEEEVERAVKEGVPFSDLVRELVREEVQAEFARRENEPPPSIFEILRVVNDGP